MKKFEDIKNDAFNALNTPDALNAIATTRGHKYKVTS